MAFSSILQCFAVFCFAMASTSALQLCEVEAAINKLKHQAATDRAENANLKSKMKSLATTYAADMDAMQWQMYHVGASAACSGVTNYQKLQRGGGPLESHNGRVYVQRDKQTCTQVCNSNNMLCVDGVRVTGLYGANTNPKAAVGYYYTLGCAWKNSEWYAENVRSVKGGEGVLKQITHSHYCCCTVMQAKNWKIIDQVTKKIIK